MSEEELPQESYLEEIQSAYLYEVMAKKERGTSRERLFLQLGAESKKQANIWAERITQSGGVLPTFTKSLRLRIVVALIQTLGPRSILPALASMKVRGLSIYQDKAVDHSEGGERHRHRNIRRGGNLRAAVFGMNDGLLSNVSLIIGMAGATSDSHILMMSGVAGLLAGAASMAAGEYISVKSQRELYEHQIALEKRELAEFPEEEAAELAIIYEARGMSPDEARALGAKMVKDPVKGLEALTREELGLNPHDLGSEWGAATSSFIAFAVGAIIPLVPLFVSPNALVWSIALSAVMLFFAGVTISLFTGRHAIYGGIRMLAIGSLAASATYGIGYFVGVNIA